MQPKQTLLLIFLLCQFLALQAQRKPTDRNYKQVYPIGDDADLYYKTSYLKSETILFEANPIVRYSFLNNIHQRLFKAENKRASAFYVAFKPQIRMYTDNSLPVKMPSYKIQLGFQKLFRVHGNNFFTIALESGHYSNGQAGCAFSELYDDGASQCDDVYKLITPKSNLTEMLNRKDGNFSTNLTDLAFNYRFNTIEEDHNLLDKVHSLTLGFTLYHDRFWGLFDFGGYSEDDIEIYGRLRSSMGYSYSRLVKRKKGEPTRILFSQNIELISGAHEWVNPVRSVTKLAYYPIGSFREFGVFTSYTYGHDNYNFRFVDSGSQFGVGITWSCFPSFVVTPVER